MHHRRFAYMHFAKSLGGLEGISLAASGAAGRDLTPLVPSIDPRGLTREEYPATELKEQIAARYDVTPEQVVLAVGTSQANALCAMAFVRSGDEVVVERPAYESLPGLIEWLGATLVRVERRREDGYAIDLDALERLIGPRTRLVMLTHPHNPSGRAFSRAELERLGAIAAKSGVPIVIDEVYRDDLPAPPPVAARLSPHLLTTSSLTKVYGLGPLRVGWVIATPELASRLSDLNDWMHVVMPSPSLLLAHAAMPHLDAWRDASRLQIAACREVLEEWRGRTGLLAGRIEEGVPFYLADLPKDDFEVAATLLAAKVIIPAGSYYEAPGRARIGYGRLAPAQLAAALEIIEKCLR